MHFFLNVFVQFPNGPQLKPELKPPDQPTWPLRFPAPLRDSSRTQLGNITHCNMVIQQITSKHVLCFSMLKSH